MMHILLIQPGGEKGGFQRFLGTLEPLSLEAVGASLAEDHDVDLIDMRFSTTRELGKRVQESKPQACGISSTFTMHYNQTVRIAELIKRSNPDTFVFVGGHHASLTPEDFYLPFIDVVVIGEGEITVKEVAKCLQERDDLRRVAGLAINTSDAQLRTSRRDLISDLDQLPSPSRWLVDQYWKRYRLVTLQPISSIETTRGCSFRCKFCSVWAFYQGKVRFKSPEKVVSEISEVKSKNIVFTDDNFLSNVRHAERIVNLIKEKGIKRRYNIQTRSDVIVSHPRLIEAWADVGLENVFLGFEKETQEELDSLTKDNTVENNEKALQILRSVGIEPVASFIVDPDYSRQDFVALAEYIRKLKLKKPSFTILTPLPGAKLFEQLVGKLTYRNYDLFDLMHPVLPTRLPLEEFCQEFAKLYRTAYPSVWRFISRVYVFFKSLMRHVPYSDWREVLIDWRRLTVPETYLEDMQRACLNFEDRGKENKQAFGKR